MGQLINNLSKRQKIGFVAVILGIMALSVALIMMSVNRNGAMARIRNLDEYMVSATSEEKNILQRRLYEFLKDSFDVKISELDIYIRDNTFVETQANEAYLTDFIIDIDELKISYAVSYVFPISAATAVNPVFDCPALSEMKYPETKCVGMYNSSDSVKVEAENPIAAVLPISVDEYDTKYRQSVKYDIFGYYDEETKQFSVRIIDYGGYSYERALKKIREKGFNPEDYTIEYISYGGE